MARKAVPELQTMPAPFSEWNKFLSNVGVLHIVIPSEPVHFVLAK
jgi:hypothetical protein